VAALDVVRVFEIGDVIDPAETLWPRRWPSQVRRQDPARRHLASRNGGEARI
jgi:hypothetical protein